MTLPSACLAFVVLFVLFSVPVIIGVLLELGDQVKQHEAREQFWARIAEVEGEE